MSKIKCAALVVGINNYDHNENLKNAVADAIAVADEFERLKYKVFRLKNATAQEFDNIFYDKLLRKDIIYDVIVVYFAGHGMICLQSDYIVFKDAEDMNLHGGIPASRCSMKVEDIYFRIRQENGYENCIVIAILDSCRKSSETNIERGGNVAIRQYETSGLTKLPFQTYLAFATSPYDGALDGKDKHSPYTKALLAEIGVKNQPIETTFKNIRKNIYKGKGTKLPWEHSCLVDEFCFNHGQLDSHYESLYYPGGYNYNLNNTNISDIMRKSRMITDTYKNTRTPYLISPLEDMTPQDQFVIGRGIMSNVLAGIAKPDDILANSFLKSFETADEENHLLNGIIYELYFNSNDSIKDWISNPDIYQLIFNLDKGKMLPGSTLMFVKSEIEPGLKECHYLPGNTILAKYKMDLSENEITNDQGNKLFVIDESSFQGNIRKIFDKFGRFAFQYSELRQVMMCQSKSPSMLLSIVTNVKLNPNDFVIVSEVSNETIKEKLRNYFEDARNSTLDEMGNHYEFGDIEYTAIESIQIHNGELKIKGSMDITAVIYLDSEEEFRSDISVEGQFRIEFSYPPEDCRIFVELDTSEYLK